MLVMSLPSGRATAHQLPPPGVWRVDGPGYPPSRGRPLSSSGIRPSTGSVRARSPSTGQDATGPCPVGPGDRRGMHPRTATHPVIALAGASGGLGVSTLAAAVALAVPRGCATLVDAHLDSGGLDVTLGVEHLAGIRWGDLAGHEGTAAGRSLRARLPAARVPVLASAGGGPGEATAREVVAGLAQEAPVVVDLPRELLTAGGWGGGTDLVVLLVGLRARRLRDAETLVERLGDLAERVVLVTRGGRRPGRVPERVADHLGLPLLDHLPDDPGVVRDEARGRPPGRRGPVAEIARAVVEAGRLGPTLLEGAAA